MRGKVLGFTFGQQALVALGAILVPIGIYASSLALWCLGVLAVGVAMYLTARRHALMLLCAMKSTPSWRWSALSLAILVWVFATFIIYPAMKTEWFLLYMTLSFTLAAGVLVSFWISALATDIQLEQLQDAQRDSAAHRSTTETS